MTDKEHDVTRERFRQDITSKIMVPGDGVSAGGTDAAWVMGVVVTALRNGDSLTMTAAGPQVQSPKDGEQWLMVQTSGSTGAPKTIRRSPTSWIASFEVTQQQFGVSATAPYAVLGALSHSLSLYAVLEALHIGSDLAVLTGLGPRAQALAIDHHAVQVLYATPTQLRLLLDGAKAPLTSLRRIFCGGGKLDAPTRARLAATCPNARIHEFFGASETSFMTIDDGTAPEGSVGRAYPGVKLRVRDDQEANTDGAGEIWVKSPYLFDGYVDHVSPDTRWRDGYLSIGEMGRLDANGYLTVLGRKTRMVTVADQNVFPEAIEAQMLSVPNVEKCAAVATKDPSRGHIIVGIVEGLQDDVLAQKIIEHCRKMLGGPATPRRIVFLEQIPLLAAGKPDLMQLAHLLEQDA